VSPLRGRHGNCIIVELRRTVGPGVAARSLHFPTRPPRCVLLPSPCGQAARPLAYHSTSGQSSDHIARIPKRPQKRRRRLQNRIHVGPPAYLAASADATTIGWVGTRQWRKRTARRLAPGSSTIARYPPRRRLKADASQRPTLPTMDLRCWENRGSQRDHDRHGECRVTLEARWLLVAPSSLGVA
jgi:hypothetical protein